MKKTWSTNSFEWITIEQRFKSSIQQKGLMLNQTSNQIYLKSTYLFILYQIQQLQMLLIEG